MIGPEHINKVTSVVGTTPTTTSADMKALFASPEAAIQGNVIGFVRDRGCSSEFESIFILAEHYDAVIAAVQAELGGTLTEYIDSHCASAFTRHPIGFRVVDEFVFTPKKRDLRIKNKGEIIASASYKFDVFSDTGYRTTVDYFALKFDQLVQLIVKVYQHWKYVHRVAGAIDFAEELTSRAGIRRLVKEPVVLDAVMQLQQQLQGMQPPQD